ncbi:SDR family NAD(P)-dependent oxidoreductase [bacterium]|nr:SDR family NAD(P)-dependent oxidoreductase [bacterium]
MSANAVLITGTSSGIGLALAQALAGRSWDVLGIARRPAAFEHPRYMHIQSDLGDADGLEALAGDRLEPWLREEGRDRIGLVNNAAVIGGLRRIGILDPRRLQRMFAVNVTAPITLMGLVIRSAPREARIRIVNVSSGAAQAPFPGLGDYSATKAALRLAGMTAATEFRDLGWSPRRAAVLSFEPGLVDTAMQDEARAADPEAFPSRQAFVEFAARGQLQPPSAVAGDVARFLEEDPRDHWTERRFGDG